ncbi:MAG: amidohydrolase [Treponema sp.]|nr:amidohydrolase [Treponema sp.]
MKGYLIKNVHVLTMNENMDEFPVGSILIEGDSIKAINPPDGASLPPDIGIIDGKGAIAVPGFINAHTHTGMIPFRSLGDDYPDRLRRFILPLERRAMTKELILLSARYACAEMLLSGITCFADMYYFEEEIASVVKEMGMRAFLGQTIMEEATCDSDEPHGALALADGFIRAWRGDELITPMIAPHATNTNSPEKIRQAAEVAGKYGVPVSMHVSEMDYEMAHFKKAYNKTPIAFLDSIGALSPRFIAVHCVYANEDDISILAASGCAVAHCIGANTKSGRGVAPVKQMLAAGVPVALGTDGPSSGNTLDMFTQFNLFAKFHKTAHNDKALFPAKEIVRLSTSGAARALGLGSISGSLEAGKKADITLIETESVNMFPVFDPYSVLVYSANSSNVDTVFVNGRLLLRGKKLTCFDLGELREKLRKEMGFFSKEAKALAKDSKHFS